MDLFLPVTDPVQMLKILPTEARSVGQVQPNNRYRSAIVGQGWLYSTLSPLQEEVYPQELLRQILRLCLRL